MKKTAKSSKKLRIAIVSDAIYPYNKGGKEKRIYEITTRLAKQNYDIHIYCMKWWKEKENIKTENGVTLHALSPLYPLYSAQRRSIKQAALFALHTLKLLKEPFDIIDADHMPHLVLFPLKIVSIIKQKKLYVTWNEVWGRKYWIKYMGPSGNIAYIIEWLTARLPDEIISISQHTTNKLVNELKVKQKIHTIPLGIDYREIQKIKPSPQKSDIIYAGRLLEHKNIDILIKAINNIKKEYPNITCRIIGNGPEEKNLKTLAHKLHLEKNIIFQNFLPQHTDLYALMKSSKLFAFPTTREGFGIAALEANACGILVITTNHPDNATKYFIKNGKNGYSVDLNNKAIAKKILYYLKQQNKNNYESYVKSYDWNIIANNVKNVYLNE